MKIKIEISAHHCHLSSKDVEILFGKGYQLKPLKPLSQPGQFAARESIALKTPAGRLDNIRILGPARETTQVEISRTDARQLNINPPVRLSGSVKKTVGVELIGPKKTIKIKSGVIVAERHIHCNPAVAEKLGLKNNQRISVKTEGVRSLTFNNVVVRIHKDFFLALHIDTDEANAALNFKRGNKTEYGLLIAKPIQTD
ncbi:MAG: phosphate propanoyltransferase [Patescibacteria group bacterium]